MGIRVLVVDDHPVVAQGLMALAASKGGQIEPLGVAASFADAQRTIADLASPPDVVLMDLHLADGTVATDNVRTLAEAGLRVVVLTSELRPIPLQRVLRAGAHGLGLKCNPVEELMEIITKVAAGDTHVTSELAFVIVTDTEVSAKLTPREIEVLQLVADGLPRKSIGAMLDPPISMTTALTHLNRACEKYRQVGVDVRTAGDVVRAATLDGYLDAPGPTSPIRHQP